MTPSTGTPPRHLAGDAFLVEVLSTADRIARDVLLAMKAAHK